MQPNWIKNKGIIKAQEGNIIWDSGKYLIPVVGTYYSIKDAVNDPSWKNIGLAGLSALGDAATIFGVGELAKAGVGAIKAGKTLKAMKPAIQAIEETSKIASKATNTYNKAKQATNAVSLMTDLDKPVSTVVKMAKKEDAARAALQAATKNADDAYTYWDGLQMLYNKQRVPINRDAVTAGMTGFVSTNAVQQAIKDEQGGVIKSQHGNKFLDTWQHLYDSKFGKGLRDFMYGQGHDLSDEEYRAKYGYTKPIGSSGMLGFLVAPEWEGLEIPEVTAMHYGMKGKPVMQAIETERLTNIPQKVVKAKPIAKPKDPYSPAMKAAFKERTGYDFDGIPEVMKQRELKSWQDYVTRLRQGHKRQ